MILTNSEMACYRGCPREHLYRYRVNKGPLVPAEALVRGTLVHECLALWDQGQATTAAMLLLLPEDRALLRAYQIYYADARLSDARANVPFHVDVGGHTLVGELDALGTLLGDGFPGSMSYERCIVEHKTTSKDITPGSAYWREVSQTAAQASAYSLAYPGIPIVWDVLRKTTLRRLDANTRRREPESDEAFESRVFEAICESPEKHFQRMTIVRLDHELDNFRRDVEDWTRVMELGESPRNPDACWKWGRPCDFFSVCWEGASIEGPGFVTREKNHTEEIAEKAGL